MAVYPWDSSNPSTTATASGGVGAQQRAELASESKAYGDAVNNTNIAAQAKADAITEANKPGGVNETAATKNAELTAAKTATQTEINKKAAYDATVETKTAEAEAARADEKAANAAAADNAARIAELKEEAAKPGADTTAINAEIARQETEKAANEAKAAAAGDKADVAELEAGIASDYSAEQDAKIATAEANQKTAQDAADTANAAKEKSDDNIKELNSKLDDAVIEEDKVKAAVGEEYPSFKEKADKMDAAVEKEKTAAALAANEEATKDQFFDDNETVAKEGLGQYYDAAAADACKTPSCLDKLMADAKAKKAAAAKAAEIAQTKANIADLEAALADQTDPIAAAAIQEELDRQNAILNKAANGDPFANNVAAQLLGAATGTQDNNKSYLYWDAPNGGYGYTGRMEDILASHMEPKQKHAYMGEFPSGLTNLDWLVRTMDRPKIDIESVEQIRNNVKRHYPIKYNFGDLSLTFWDDVHNKTIKTIDSYFNNNVWMHPVYKSTGAMLLRDQTVIPEFHIYDLVPGTNAEVVKYSFYNAVLVSYDFDAHDTDDDGIHTIQVVFKVEAYKLTYGVMPRTLNNSNTPVWL